MRLKLIVEYSGQHYELMLGLTSKAKYGIPAVLELAQHYGSGLIQAKDVAQRQSIPQNYLEQLMNMLVKAGIVRAVRGKSGGYALAVNPEQITLFEILEVLEGPLELKASGPQNSTVKEIFSRTEKKLREILSVSIADLLLLQKDTVGSWNFQI